MKWSYYTYLYINKRENCYDTCLYSVLNGNSRWPKWLNRVDIQRALIGFSWVKGQIGRKCPVHVSSWCAIQFLGNRLSTTFYCRWKSEIACALVSGTQRPRTRREVFCTMVACDAQQLSDTQLLGYGHMARFAGVSDFGTHNRRMPISDFDLMRSGGRSKASESMWLCLWFVMPLLRSRWTIPCWGQETFATSVAAQEFEAQCCMTSRISSQSWSRSHSISTFNEQCIIAR